MSPDFRRHRDKQMLRAVSVLLTVLLAIFVFHAPAPAMAQDAPVPLIAQQGDVARVVAPGTSSTLSVLVTNRSGAPLNNTTVLFVAPGNGPDGYFPAAQPANQTWIRVVTGANGIASATFVTGPTDGVFLVEAVVEQTGASATFAFTISETPVAPPLSAAGACTGVVEQILENATLDETLQLHGPVLLAAGTQVAPAIVAERPEVPGPRVAEKLSWLFWIDDAPLARFAHPVRYVLVDASETGDDAFAHALIWHESWWPEVFPPSAVDPMPLVPPSGANDNVTPAEQAASSGGELKAVWPAPRYAPADACAILIFGPDCTGARKDIRDFQRYLQAQDLVSPGNILTNDKVIGGDTIHQVPASKDDIQDLINKAKARGCKTVYWVYSGHGASTVGSGGIALSKPGGGSSVLPYDDLVHMLEGLGGVELRAVEDACFSGQFVEWLQGRGFTGQVVSAADTEHKSWGDPSGGNLVQGLLGELDKMGDPDLEEALRWLKEHSNPDGHLRKSNPQGSGVSTDGVRKMRLPFVFVASPGQSKRFRIPRPLAPAADSVLGGPVSVASTAVAALSGDHITFAPSSDVTLSAMGRSNGSTTYSSDVVDHITNKEYKGGNGIQVGAFKFSDGILTLPEGTEKTVQLTRYGITMDPELGPSDKRTVFRFLSRDPRIAVPVSEYIPMSRHQTSVLTDIEGISPGQTIIDVFDRLTRTTKSIKVIVTPVAVPGEELPKTIDPMDGHITCNPGHHPFTDMHTRCTFTWHDATSFILKCEDPSFLDITGTFSLSNNTFRGEGQGRVLGAYDVHAKVTNGTFLAPGQNQAAGIRAATGGFVSVHFNYELGSNGGFPGGQSVQWDVTGTLPPSGGCSYALSPASAEVTRVGTLSWVTVTTPQSCTWTATSNSAWIRILSSTSGTGSDTLTFQYQPNHEQASRTGTLTIGGETFTLTQEGQSSKRPVILKAVNGASFSGGIGQDSWVTITGAGLASTTRIWNGATDFNGNRLPTQLDGVSATINGKPAYIYYISPTQLNVLSEVDTSDGTMEIRVTNSEGTSNMITAVSRQIDPALFLFDPEERKYVAAVHTDRVYLGKEGLFEGLTTRPAKPGDILLLYGTGFGPTDPPTPPGMLVQASPCVKPVTARIGGRNAVVQYAGKTGSGLYQFNVLVPELPDGDHEVQLYVDGIPTQSGAYLTVQRGGT